MNIKPLFPILPVLLALGASGVAAEDDYAKVLSVVEIKEVVKTPKEVCKDVVGQGTPPADEHKVLGTVGGAVVGGLLGNQIGGGTGKTIATVAGTAAGALGGRKIQENQQQKKAQSKVEKQCETVTESTEKVIGYDVKYLYNGKEETVRTSRKPSGDRIPVKDGRLVIE